MKMESQDREQPDSSPAPTEGGGLKRKSTDEADQRSLKKIPKTEDSFECPDHGSSTTLIINLSEKYKFERMARRCTHCQEFLSNSDEHHPIVLKILVNKKIPNYHCECGQIFQDKMILKIHIDDRHDGVFNFLLVVNCDTRTERSLESILVLREL
ncbi:hypothetical protein TKK_0007052 [Trichogramma kaykai]|uniref:C2H2-type domain-containing protein n=1 Tax=Trichogramma kaykai TaxID=54128 RepID=A0ABD2X944_9HYME